MAKQKYTGQMTTGQSLAKMLVPDASFLTPSWTKKITDAALYFFSNNPERNTVLFRETICFGEYDSLNYQFGNLEGFTQLQEVLKNYREQL